MNGLKQYLDEMNEWLSTQNQLVQLQDKAHMLIREYGQTNGGCSLAWYQTEAGLRKELPAFMRTINALHLGSDLAAQVAQIHDTLKEYAPCYACDPSEDLMWQLQTEDLSPQEKQTRYDAIHELCTVQLGNDAYSTYFYQFALPNAKWAHYYRNHTGSREEIKGRRPYIDPSYTGNGSPDPEFRAQIEHAIYHDAVLEACNTLPLIKKCYDERWSLKDIKKWFISSCLVDREDPAIDEKIKALHNVVLREFAVR